MTNEFDSDDMNIVTSDGPLGNLLKKVTRKKVDLKHGIFGVALDRTELRGGVANLLTDTWKGLQRLGTSGIEGFASPQTLSVARTEAPTALKISITGVTSRVFSLMPPKAYIFTQLPEAQIPAEVKSSGIIIVPGLILRIFRLIGNNKAPETAKFISVDENSKTKGTEVTAKAFTVTLGDNASLGPIYMPVERINELLQHGGNSAAIVFPRKSIGSGDINISDSLLRSQGGAIMFILDRERLQWVVSVEFSPFYESQQGLSNSAGGSFPRTTTLVPPPPTDALKPPPSSIASKPPASTPTSDIAVKSAMRTAGGKPNYNFYMMKEAEMVEMKPLAFDFRNYPDANMVSPAFLATNVSSQTIDTTLSLVSATMGTTLVLFSHQPKTIAIFAENMVFKRANNIKALIKQMDRVLLAMDAACLRLWPVLDETNTLKNNWFLGVTYILGAIYLRHNGRENVEKRDMVGEPLLPTWNQSFLPLNESKEYAIFPSTYFTSGKEISVGLSQIMETLPVLDAVAHAMILNKYATSKYLTGRESNTELMAYATKRLKIDITALFHVAVLNNHGNVKNMPALFHIMACLYQAAGAYFMREAQLSEDTIRSLIAAANITRTDKQLAELKELMLEPLNRIREREPAAKLNV